MGMGDVETGSALGFGVRPGSYVPLSDWGFSSLIKNTRVDEEFNKAKAHRL